MKILGPRPTPRTCFVEGCGRNAAYRVISPADPYDLKLACRKCRGELVAVHGWEAVR